MNVVIRFIFWKF